MEDEEVYNGKVIISTIETFMDSVKKLNELIMKNENLSLQEKLLIGDLLTSFKFLLNLLLSDLSRRNSFFLGR